MFNKISNALLLATKQIAMLTEPVGLSVFPGSHNSRDHESSMFGIIIPYIKFVI